MVPATIVLMAEAPSQYPEDSLETGRLLTLAGAKLAEIIQSAVRPTAYYAAADALGIYQTTLTRARLQATQQGFIRHDFTGIQDRLTETGSTELATAIPIGEYATALGALLANQSE